MVTKEDLKVIPDKPGVYLMKDVNGKIIYVGKAISLKNRVRSYFQSSRRLSPKVQLMVNHIESLEYITTDSEVEALVLECNLIKKEHPKYNIRLRDDKQYPWIKVTWDEMFPRIFITRKRGRETKRDGSKYYGPYTDTGAIRDIFKMLRHIFPIRSCRHDLEKVKIERPCLNYHIKQCLAPCCGGISKEAYRDIISEVCLFLEGRQVELVEKLWGEMLEASSKQEFERAAMLRDRIRDIKKILERQRVVSDAHDDLDVFGIAQDNQGSIIQVFQIRNGKLVGREYFQTIEGDETAPDEILEAFLTQYYDGAGYIPRDILLPFNLENAGIFEKWLTCERGIKVSLKVPQKGDKLDLVKMAFENAQNLLVQLRNRESRLNDSINETLNELKKELNLATIPKRIEGFDISNIQGEEAVASMVVFEDGVPKKSDYRRFKIRTIEGPNDFAMLQEAVKRRFRRGLEEQQEQQIKEGKFAIFPDLLLIDGGKGQLSGVLTVLDELGLSYIRAIGLAKQEEEIFVPDQEESIRLSRHSSALMLLQRIRDEAHRFAITFHRDLREKHAVKSALDKLSGIGPKRKQLLLKHFGSVKRIQEASIEELVRVPGINPKIAMVIKEQLEDI